MSVAHTGKRQWNNCTGYKWLHALRVNAQSSWHATAVVERSLIQTRKDCESVHSSLLAWFKVLFAGKSGMKQPYTEGTLRKWRNCLKKKKKNMLLFQRGKPSSPVSLSFLCSVVIYLTLVSQTIASTIRATGMRSWLYHVEHIFCLILNYLWRTLYLITKTDSPAVVLANSSQMACQQV